MKGMKKLLSILMVLTLVLSLGASAFAANVTIGEAKDSATHTYTAYQIFSGTAQAAGEGAIGNLAWGDGINASAFVEALKSQLPAIFGELEKGADDQYNAQKVAAALGKLSDTSPELKTVAEIARQNVVSTNGTELVDKSTQLPIGYYVILDTTENLQGADEVRNSVVLEVTQDVEVTFKTDIPSSDKKVKDKNDTNPTDPTTNGDWGTTADYDIGDQVPFQLTATIPANTTTAYSEYKLVFHDHEEKGLTFNKGSVKVTVGDQELTLDEDYTITTPGTELEDACTFEITIENIKDAIDNFDPAKAYVITVDYTSELNRDAVIGNDGNHNEMQLEFSNDYTNGGTGKDTPKKVVVFTYDLNVDKIDQDKKPLAGAKFELYKVVTEAGTDTVEPSSVNQLKNEDTLSGKFLKKVELTPNDAGTSFYGKGLDDGDYWIIETETPTGYNSIPPKSFTVSAEHGDKVTSLSGTGDFDFTLDRTGGEGDAAEGQADIMNQQGATLPETGGIGTTIFYIAGAILVAGAVILLVTKKRVSGMEK